MGSKLYSMPATLAMCIMCILFTAASGQNPAGRFVADELLVKFAGGPASNEARDANRKIGATNLETLGDLGWQRVRLPAGTSVSEATRRYKALAGVEAVQPNFYYQLLATPNDPQFTSSGMYGLGKISAPLAWDLTTGSPEVVVANIDTGMRYTHEDLAANAWINPGEIPGNGIDEDDNGFVDDIYGADFFYGDANPWDEHGHGTHTGGTIGAAGNNGVGVVGVNWSVKIMTIKIYDNTGFGTTSAMLINAYNYVRDMKLRGINIRVTNNSYSGCDEACDYDQATKNALDEMGDAGILNVFAAGNSSSNNDISPHYPSNYTSPSVVAVASSNQTDQRSGFSSFGLNSVDLAAPGSGILSTTFGSNSNYGISSGTSMATPHVAGAAALLSAFDPSLSVSSLKATLLNTVDVLPAWTGIVKTGGRLNVDRALRERTVCTFQTPNTTITVPTKGGVFSVNIAAGQNCDYSVKSTANWISVMSSDNLSGNGTVTFRVTVNPTITRTGTILIGGETLSIRQSRN